MTSRLASIACCALFAAACSSSSNTSFGGKDAGAGAGGTAGTGGTTSGGAGGTTTGGAGGTGGVPGPVDCQGSFGTPVPLVDNGQYPLSSPALPDDELEMFVSVSPDGTTFHFARTQRADAGQPFGPLQVVPELDAACASPDEARTIDVSRDGLRAYVSCDDGSGAAQPLQLFTRASRTATFAAQKSQGDTLGGSVALSADELSAYSSAYSNPGAALVATRGSRLVAFGPAAPIPGLETVDVIAPDVSDDGLVLFGGLGGQQLVMATRSNAASSFGAPQNLTIPQDIAGAPHITHDCHRLYYVGYTYGSPDDFAVYVMSR